MGRNGVLGRVVGLVLFLSVFVNLLSYWPSVHGSFTEPAAILVGTRCSTVCTNFKVAWIGAVLPIVSAVLFLFMSTHVLKLSLTRSQKILLIPAWGFPIAIEAIAGYGPPQGIPLPAVLAIEFPVILWVAGILPRSGFVKDILSSAFLLFSIAELVELSYDVSGWIAALGPYPYKGDLVWGAASLSDGLLSIPVTMTISFIVSLGVPYLLIRKIGNRTRVEGARVAKT